MSFTERVMKRSQRMIKGESPLYDLHPELIGRVPIMRVYSDEDGGETQDNFVNDAKFYNINQWVHKAIKIKADNVAPLPLIVADKDNEEIPSHPLLDVLSNPNPSQDAAEFWREWLINMDLGGDVGVEVVYGKVSRSVKEMWLRRPDQYSVKSESARYKRVQYYRVDDNNGDPYRLTPEEFIQIKYHNPLSVFRGVAPLTAARMSIVIDELAQAWTRLFFRNQARPDYAVIAPEGTTSREREELEEKLWHRFGGDGVKRPIILENGVTDIKVFSWAPADMEWATQREFSRDEIGAVFGVPDEIMGYGKDTYENFNTAEHVLWTLTLVPLIGLRDGALTRWFRTNGLLKPTEKIKTDVSSVSQLQDDISSKLEQWDILVNRGVPMNMAADFVGLGLEQIPGGDVGYLQAGMLPIDKLSVIYEQRMQPVQEQSEEEPPPDTEQEEEQYPEEEPKSVKSNKATVPEYGSDEHMKLWEAKQARLDKPVETLQRIAKKEFQRQQNEIGQKLRDSKVYGRGKFKAPEDRVPSPQELFNIEEEIKLFVKAFQDEVTAAVALVASDELATLGLDIVFEVDRPDVQAAIKGILAIVSQKTNETTWMNLVSIFEAAEQAGEGIPAIQERLAAYFGDRKSDYQTERIARTTMTGASNSGQLAAWKQSQIVKKHTWISALQPNRTRDAHAEAHGQTVGLGEMFTVGGEMLEYPGDPNGSPGNIINCLCTTKAEVEYDPIELPG